MKQQEFPVDSVRVAFDVATHSLDFGSGWLDNDEVTHLRGLAVLLGVDPWLATPPNFRAQFCPGHEWTEWRRWRADHPERRYCVVCDKAEKR